MSKEKLARRKAMGDDPTAVSKSNTTEAGSISPQPIPGADQKNNVMNNPQVGMSMGGGAPSSGSMTGQNMYPYADGGIPAQGGAMGAIGFTQPSGIPQNKPIGTIHNSRQRFGDISSPVEENARMMEPYYLAEEAANRAQKLYGPGQMPSYHVGPLGMMGTPLEVGQPNPGQMPSQMSGNSENYLGLTGTPDVQAGMNMGTGNRNATKGEK